MEILKSKVKMSMFGGSGLPSGIHGDVLNANPSEPAEVERLVEEIKGRAKKRREKQEASRQLQRATLV